MEKTNSSSNFCLVAALLAKKEPWLKPSARIIKLLKEKFNEKQLSEFLKYYCNIENLSELSAFQINLLLSFNSLNEIITTIHSA